jgi:hypothetical protein
MDKNGESDDNRLSWFDSINTCINIDRVSAEDDKHGHINII